MHRTLSTLPLLLAAFALSVHANEDVAALIQRQSQAFSDASASGDAAALARYLDDRVVFMNEGGDIATKKDIVESAKPPAAGVSMKLEQRDFHVELHGTVAVTSFTDVLHQEVAGQKLTAKFLSTEVWLREGEAWRMISSQTMAVPDDPPTVSLPEATLEEYVGTYSAGPGFTFRIARAGDGLTGSMNGGAPFKLEAELRDVLVTPGQPRVRRVFARNAAGKITGFVSRREGHDLVLKRIG
ncbi:MAG TPA: DUF4440 domain-containing protein [Rudaea sp.]|nr:DUF4440 domain-containing protein [Rudaea sp.]